MIRDDLGTRMKEYYEGISKTKLMRRTPVAIRIDGKAFHTFTRGMQKPFDEVLMRSMQDTMKYLCENIQGCVLGYTQSDEITLILVDYKRLNSSAWFDYEVQKICSIAASMATLAFNRNFEKRYDEWGRNTFDFWDEGGTNEPINADDVKMMETYSKALKRGAMFDARCFNIPKEEVTNLVYWRQLDASRNSVQMVGHTNFSDKELHKKSCNDIQDMLMLQKGINWNDFPIDCKRGSCCVRNKIIIAVDGNKECIELRNEQMDENCWIVDREIPIFKGEDRQYIETLLKPEEI